MTKHSVMRYNKDNDLFQIGLVKARELRMERIDQKTIKLKEKIYKELKVTFQSIEQQIKEIEDNKAEYAMKCELYGQCLSEHLLSSGADIIQEHLADAHAEMENCDRELDKLKLLRDAYRIEIEIYENNMRQQ